MNNVYLHEALTENSIFSTSTVFLGEEMDTPHGAEDGCTAMKENSFPYGGEAPPCSVLPLVREQELGNRITIWYCCCASVVNKPVLHREFGESLHGALWEQRRSAFCYRAWYGMPMGPSENEITKYPALCDLLSHRGCRAAKACTLWNLRPQRNSCTSVI